MRKILASCLPAVCLSLVACQPKTPAPHYTLVTIGHVTVKAEVSDTSDLRVRGLQFREKLADNEGMLFIYDQPDVLVHWMKDMKIPLDMIWIDQSKKIVGISADVSACKVDPCPTYSSKVPAKYVLEVDKGFAAEHHIQPGMTVSFS